MKISSRKWLAKDWEKNEFLLGFQYDFNSILLFKIRDEFHQFKTHFFKENKSLKINLEKNLGCSEKSIIKDFEIFSLDEFEDREIKNFVAILTNYQLLIFDYEDLLNGEENPINSIDFVDILKEKAINSEINESESYFESKRIFCRFAKNGDIPEIDIQIIYSLKFNKKETEFNTAFLRFKFFEGKFKTNSEEIPSQIIEHFVPEIKILEERSNFTSDIFSMEKIFPKGEFSLYQSQIYKISPDIVRDNTRYENNEKKINLTVNEFSQGNFDISDIKLKWDKKRAVI